MQTIDPQLEQHAGLQPLLGFKRTLAQQCRAQKPRIGAHLAGNGGIVQTGVGMPLVGTRLENRTVDADGISCSDMGAPKQQRKIGRASCRVRGYSWGAGIVSSRLEY